jgi:protein-S-isoprenylcysteine O-methyltransferase Ste14
MKKDRKLLERRMSGGPTAEKEPTQKIIMYIVSLGFIGLLFLPALDHRFAWSHMPPYVALAGDVLIVLGWLAIFFVFKENTFTFATIELAPDQKVISTGPYALVRHPMYAGALVMLLGIPIALGSWWGLLVIVAMMPALIWRLFDEEKFLVRNQYCSTCGMPMRLTRITPRLGGLRELRTFECRPCNVVVTEERDQNLRQS